MSDSGVWIPVSERLPEKSGRYLVTENLCDIIPFIEVLEYGEPAFPKQNKKCFYRVDAEYGDVPYDEVLAWMPLPEPYGGE